MIFLDDFLRLELLNRSWADFRELSSGEAAVVGGDHPFWIFISGKTPLTGGSVQIKVSTILGLFHDNSLVDKPCLGF